MQGFTKKQIDYVLFHFNHQWHLNEDIRSRFLFTQELSGKIQNRIVFPLSQKPLDQVKRIKSIPILFPLTDNEIFYKIDNGGNLVFAHDLLKSAFYLLSGYQEIQPHIKDELGRYPFSESIQNRLNIVDLPLVNYYFDKIAEGIREYCESYHIRFESRNLWNGKKCGFILSHDIDRVDKWTFREMKLKMKQAFGLYPSPYSKRITFYLLLKSIIYFFSKQNPYWNFEWLTQIEKKHDMKSVWFFLPQGEKNIDAFYSLEENRIKQLAQFLEVKGDEIGLHGVLQSKNDIHVMTQNLTDVQKLAVEKIRGIRQHWLSFEYPQTLQNQEKLKLDYDSSWYFAQHAGWRNSYCLPFRPYDVEKDRMMDIWEIPLCLMDASLFDYQQLNLQRGKDVFEQLFNHVKAAGGLFVCLWHNSYFDEYKVPGITDFYQWMLAEIAKSDTECILPRDLIDRLESLNEPLSQ